jgi:hypothetical protein
LIAQGRSNTVIAETTTAGCRLRSSTWGPDRSALQLLGPDNVRIARVRREQGVRLCASACAGRPLLPADL